MAVYIYRHNRIGVSDASCMEKCGITLYVKYRVRINYRRNLQNHIFTNTDQKYMMLLPFEREMFAVS